MVRPPQAENNKTETRITLYISRLSGPFWTLDSENAKKTKALCVPEITTRIRPKGKKKVEGD
jgi:hypothetical protein